MLMPVGYLNCLLFSKLLILEAAATGRCMDKLRLLLSRVPNTEICRIKMGTAKQERRGRLAMSIGADQQKLGSF